MPQVSTDDGVRLHVEETGEGTAKTGKRAMAAEETSK